MTNSSPKPRVCILVAARNEADSISRCLKALNELHFPQNELEIWIGNDMSTDATEQLVLEFIEDKPHFHYYQVQKQWEGLRGKANVLAQLAEVAKGEYLFFCDADIAVHPDWVTTMLNQFREGVGVVVGVTRMTQEGFFASMQSIEWLLSLAAMRFFSFWDIPFTGMGNNMAVTRKAYKKTGGYPQLGFSIVEDYALFQAILAQGFQFVQAFQPEIVSVSKPSPDLKALLRQRKRWVHGAMQAPFPLRLTFYGTALLLPTLLLLLLFVPGTVLFLSVLHALIVCSVAVLTLLILKQSDLLVYVPGFWMYFLIINTLMLFNYLLPTPVIWKDRTY